MKGREVRTGWLGWVCVQSRIESPLCQKKSKSKTLIILPSHHTHTSSPIFHILLSVSSFHYAASRLAQLFQLNATFLPLRPPTLNTRTNLPSLSLYWHLIQDAAVLLHRDFFGDDPRDPRHDRFPQDAHSSLTGIRYLWHRRSSLQIRMSLFIIFILVVHFFCLFDLALVSLTKKIWNIVCCVFGIDLFQGQENDGGRDDHRRTRRILIPRSPEYRTSSSSPSTRFSSLLLPPQYFHNPPSIIH